MKKTLKDLHALQSQLKVQAQRQREQQQAQRLALEKMRSQASLFTQTVGPVLPLPAKHGPDQQAQISKPLPAPVAKQKQRDEQAVMSQAISDAMDVQTLLETDDTLSFRRVGIGPDVTRKLRRGVWCTQGELDLHGLRTEQARLALGQFIRHAKLSGWRCVRVVHGKGLGSPGKVPVLKSKVHSWLVQKNEVLAFVQARAADGGAGALVVLLAAPG